MDNPVIVEIKGLDKLQSALEDIALKVGQKGVRDALKAGAHPIEQGMKNEAPRNVKDPRVPAGYLAAHIGTKYKMEKNLLAGSAFIGPDGKLDYPAFVSGAFRIVRTAHGRVKKVGSIAVRTVARWLEFGTSKMSKNPFMTRAWEAHKNESLAAITSSLAATVESAAKKK